MSTEQEIKKARSIVARENAKRKWAKYDTPEKRRKVTEKMRIARHKKKD